MSRNSFNNETLLHIGERIREVRGTDRQIEFAKKIGVSRASLANYERGRRLANYEMLEKIASLGKTTVSWILHGSNAAKEIEKYYNLINDKTKNEPASNPAQKLGISDHELSLIKCIRELSHPSFESILNKIVKISRSESEAIFSEFYEYIATDIELLEDVLANGGFQTGFDPDRIIWMNLHIESIKKEKKPSTNKKR